MEKIIELVTGYIDPIMWAIVPILAAVGAKSKKWTRINDRFIPIIIIASGGLIGGLFAWLFEGIQMHLGIFQGILLAGLETWGYNAYKQLRK